MWTEKKLDHDPYSQQEHNPKAYSTRAQQEAKQGGRKKKIATAMPLIWEESAYKP